jgi:hypothetical protein
VATESVPPDEGGGNLKYGIIGLLLLGGVIGLWGLMTYGGDPDPVVLADTGPANEPSTALAEPMIELPDPEPDTGPDVGVDTGPRGKQIVYRYVRDEWDCQGEIDASAAAGVVRGYNRQIRNCYERQLKVNHTLAGRLNVLVRVGSNGQVTGTRVNGSLRSPPVFACVRNLASGWSFPNPSRGCAVVSVPFNFSPRE